MKKIITSSFIIIIFTCLTIQAQVATSEKSYLKINTKAIIDPPEPIDTIAPELRILSPLEKSGDKYISTVAEINLIGKAVDENELSSVIVNSEIKKTTDEGVFTAPLVLYKGDNEVTIILMDSKENYRESRLIIEYQPPELTFEELVNKESRYFGLIIGVSNYEDPQITSLDNTINDSQKLLDVLTLKYNFENENMIFLEDASRKDIIESLDVLATKMTSNDNLLIFYAGHGWWDEAANNGYWLPADARRGNKTDWFRNSTLVDYLKEIKSRHTLLITDACFGGAILKTRKAFPEASKAIKMLYKLPSRKAMTSGTREEEVPDRSAFIHYLLERLEQNTEKYLSSEQLFSSLRIAVINNSDCIPQYGEIKNVGDQGGDFIFIKK